MAHRGSAARRLSPAELWGGELAREGYCIIPNLVPAATAAALHDDLRLRFEQTPFCEGGFYGDRTKRFGGLLKRSDHAQAFVAHPLILEIVQDALGAHCDRFQLNLTQALEIHPGQPVQPPHRDQDMWQGPKGEIEYLVNVMWPFTDYTAENGATLVWPRSHRPEVQASPPEGAPIAAEMAPGSALVFLGSTLHAAGANRSAAIRAGMIISYSLGWLKPYENQWLVYPPEVARRFPPGLAALAGYQQHRPNLGNYEGRCPSILLQDGVPEFLGAVDELRPDQVAAIETFRRGQNG